MTRPHLVVLSGAGMSAESGLKTFRGPDALWETHRVQDVASPEAWARDPEMVLRFYNERRKALLAAEPNAGHCIIAEWERRFHVSVITQNVDDLHERAGSTRVLHLHGELRKARSTADPSCVYPISGWNLSLGDTCKLGSQLRPHIVWFGETVMELDAATSLVEQADILIVVGTSLQVYPAAGLAWCTPDSSLRYLIDPDPPPAPGFELVEDLASRGLARLAAILSV